MLSELPRGWGAGAASGCCWAGRGCHVPGGQEEEAGNARKEGRRQEAWEGSLLVEGIHPRARLLPARSEWLEARCSLPQAHPLQRPPQAPGSRVQSRVGRGTEGPLGPAHSRPRPLAAPGKSPGWEEAFRCLCGGQRRGLDCAPAS